MRPRETCPPDRFPFLMELAIKLRLNSGTRRINQGTCTKDPHWPMYRVGSQLFYYSHVSNPIIVELYRTISMSAFDPTAWRHDVDYEFGSKELILWVEEDTTSLGLGLEGVEPPRSSPAWKDWYRTYALATSLLLKPLSESARKRVVREADYVALDRYCPFFSRFATVQRIISQLHDQGETTESEDLTVADRSLTTPTPATTTLPASQSPTTSRLGTRSRDAIGPSGLTPSAKRVLVDPTLDRSRPSPPVFAAPAPATFPTATSAPVTRPSLTPRRAPAKTPTGTPRYASQTVASAARSSASSASQPLAVSRRNPSVKLPPMWQYGLKCVLCGNTSGYKAHPSFLCKATHMDADVNDAVEVTYVEKPQAHLVHKDGREICADYNYYRHHPNYGCDFNPCPYLHICSLCHQGHGAIDCGTRVYNPPLSGKTIIPVPISSARNLVHCRFIDSWFDPKPKQPAIPSRELLDPTGSSLPRLTWDVADSLKWDKRRTLYNMYQKYAVPDLVYPKGILRDPHRYPHVVPSCIPLRDGYTARVLPSHFKSVVDDELYRDIMDLFDSAQGPARRLSTAELKSAFESDLARVEMIKRLERERKVPAEEVDLTSEGLPGSARFQLTDGSMDAASVVLMAHYPPAHTDPYGLTRMKHGAEVLGQEGLMSPTLCGDARLAFTNVVPVMFRVDEDGGGGIKMKSGKSYPSPIIDSLKDDAVKGILVRARKGTQQLVVGWGSLPKNVLAEAGVKASQDPTLRVDYFNLTTRKVRQWEAGIPSTELLILRQEHLGSTVSLKPTDKLFGPMAVYNSLEAGYAGADRLGSQTVKLPFTAIRPRSGPNKGKCMLLLGVPHMTTSLRSETRGGLETMQCMDYAITLCEDLIFRTFQSRCYRQQAWRFMGSFARREKQAGCLSPAEIKMLEDLSDWELKRGIRVEPSALLPSMFRLYNDISLCGTTEHSKGLEFQGESICALQTMLTDLGDDTDVIKILISASQSRASRFKGSKPETPREQAQKALWRTKGSETLMKDTKPGPAYRSICLHGIEGVGESPLRGTTDLRQRIQEWVRQHGSHRRAVGR